MPRYVPWPPPTRAARWLRIAMIVVVGACQPESCDDPTGPDVQASVGGRVTLNGEPLEGITVGSGSATTVTSATGSYGLTIQGEDFPLLACVEVRTEPYPTVIEAVSLAPGCPLTLTDERGQTVDFAFAHEPPSLRITRPPGGARIEAGSYTIEATRGGSVTVNGVGPVLPLPTVWSSSLDGPLGEALFGQAVFVTLSPGTHTITATYTDFMNITVSDEVTIEVFDGDNQPPTATITSPESGLAYPNGVALDFAGTGTDPEDGVLTGAALTWTSSQEGDVGTGESFSRLMAAGSHVIVLTATDASAASSADTIFIHINEPTAGEGTIQGTVSIGGDPLPDIPVALSGTATANTITNAQGVYSFTDLAPGPYAITITPPVGADIATQQSVTLADGQTLTVNFSG